VEDDMLRNPHSNKCLDVRQRKIANGTPLQIWECNPGQTNQSWRLASHPAPDVGPKPAPTRPSAALVTGD
jgi:hypothetical protein